MTLFKSGWLHTWPGALTTNSHIMLTEIFSVFLKMVPISD